MVGRTGKKISPIFYLNLLFKAFKNSPFSSQTNIGPILLSVNPYTDVGNPLTLNSMRSVGLNDKLLRVVQDAVRQQSETGYPQAIILSGEKLTFYLFIIRIIHKKHIEHKIISGNFGLHANGQTL